MIKIPFNPCNTLKVGLVGLICSLSIHNCLSMEAALRRMGHGRNAHYLPQKVQHVTSNKNMQRRDFHATPVTNGLLHDLALDAVDYVKYKFLSSDIKNKSMTAYMLDGKLKVFYRGYHLDGIKDIFNPDWCYPVGEKPRSYHVFSRLENIEIPIDRRTIEAWDLNFFNLYDKNNKIYALWRVYGYRNLDIGGKFYSKYSIFQVSDENNKVSHFGPDVFLKITDATFKISHSGLSFLKGSDFSQIKGYQGYSIHNFTTAFLFMSEEKKLFPTLNIRELESLFKFLDSGFDESVSNFIFLNILTNADAKKDEIDYLCKVWRKDIPSLAKFYGDLLHEARDEKNLFPPEFLKTVLLGIYYSKMEMYANFVKGHILSCENREENIKNVLESIKNDPAIDYYMNKHRSVFTFIPFALERGHDIQKTSLYLLPEIEKVMEILSPKNKEMKQKMSVSAAKLLASHVESINQLLKMYPKLHTELLKHKVYKSYIKIFYSLPFQKEHYTLNTNLQKVSVIDDEDIELLILRNHFLNTKENSAKFSSNLYSSSNNNDDASPSFGDDHIDDQTIE